ncbi:site-specific integrase [Lutibacter sp. HS1-25]|uniref:site-specific integrase n=1 Tax=Lutibacter sp. HS1-25 TaxID=2485000 RepID=UPI001012EF0F|nr:site-specific integrase [Lutibacter sp. HS1-25]RXP54823.1 site-specific integrase [Lutibacter sp. HS1-25]
MKTQNTFSILIWINASRAKNNEAELFARITVNQKRANISLKRKINIDHWDKSKSRLKGNSEKARKQNQFIEQIKAKLQNIHLDLFNQKKLITAQLIKSTFLGEGENHKTLLNLIDYHSNKIKNTLAPGTVRNFEITENYVTKFLEHKRKTTDIYLNQLDYKFICDFENYLHNYWPNGHPKAMGQNTVMKHIQRFRKMVTLAYHLEWLPKDPFIRWKPTFEKTQREFLSQNELSNLETYHFPIERLERVRDLFVFSCYTGISYIDIMELSKDNVHIGIDGNKWIITKRHKTKTPVKVPLLEKSLDLLIKYENHPMTEVSGTLFPVITNEKLNLYLKEIAEAAGITKNLTFHMARHTFATTVTLTNGVPIETVSKMLGHTKIATTQIYARVIERKVSDDMNALRAILNNNKSNENNEKKAVN